MLVAGSWKGWGLPGSAAPAASHDSARERRLDGVRLLLVEDDEDSRTVTQLILEMAGASVVSVESAALARAALHAERFDVVVSDIGMPGENGYALARSVRALPPEEGGDVPMIALTALVGPEDEARGREAGFDAHLGKPVEQELLVATLLEVARPPH